MEFHAFLYRCVRKPSSAWASAAWPVSGGNRAGRRSIPDGTGGRERRRRERRRSSRGAGVRPCGARPFVFAGKRRGDCKLVGGTRKRRTDVPAGMFTFAG